jgi:hypothetical protein
MLIWLELLEYASKVFQMDRTYSALNLSTFGLFALFALILAYFGIPFATSYGQMLCGRLHISCPFVSQWVFIWQGMLDFLLWFVIFALISNVLIIPILRRYVFHPK